MRVTCWRGWSIGALVCMASLVGSGAGLVRGADAEPTPAGKDAATVEISAAETKAEALQRIGELDHPEFEVRDRATRRLREIGAVVAPQLAETVLKGSPEASQRAIDLLAGLYRSAKFPGSEGVEDALAELRNAEGQVGLTASRVWESLAADRERRAVARLTLMGARVQYVSAVDPAIRALQARGDMRQRIQFVVISRKWTGGDEGLKVLGHISQPEGFQVYHVNGARVSDEAMQSVADLGLQVARRGAFLGISSNTLVGAGDDNRGCIVGGVTEGSPAEKAGIEEGDLIVRYRDQPITNFDDLIKQLNAAEPGQVAEFELIRNGQERLVKKVELGDW